jgi:hypothetical protein
LRLQPGNSVATEGLRKVAEALIVAARMQLDDDNLTGAKRLFEAARRLAPKLRNVAEFADRLERATPEVAQLDADQQAHLDELLRAASAAREHGDLLTPPSDSAYDKLRQAQSIAPKNAAVIAATNALCEALRTRVSDAVNSAQLDPAVDAFVGWKQLRNSDPALAASRSELATALVAAVEKNIEGDKSVAQKWLQALKRVQPSHPRIAELAAKIVADAAASN